jgi:hypothetical protein
MAYMEQAVRKGIRKQKYVYSKNKNSAYHWSYVLRAKDADKRKKIAEGIDRAVKCGKISYSNTKEKNASLYDAVKNKGFDCSKLKKRTTTNCCNLVSVACNYAGIKTPRKSSARTMATKWPKYGFKLYKFTGKNLQKGDILVDNTEPKVHTAVYIG